MTDDLMIYDEKIKGAVFDGTFPQYIICSELSDIDISQACAGLGSMIVSDSKISGITLKDLQIDGMMILSSELEDVVFDNADLSEAIFDTSVFKGCTFANCEMPHDMINSMYSGCRFLHCHYFEPAVQNTFKDCVFTKDGLLLNAEKNRFERCGFNGMPLPHYSMSNGPDKVMARNSFIGCRAKGDMWADNTLDADLLYDAVTEQSR